MVFRMILHGGVLMEVPRLVKAIMERTVRGRQHQSHALVRFGIRARSDDIDIRHRALDLLKDRERIGRSHEL